MAGSKATYAGLSGPKVRALRPLLTPCYMLLNYVRVNCVQSGYACVGRNFSKYGVSTGEICLANFALFVNHFLCESGPTSYKMHLWGMLYSWYGSVPVEYDDRVSYVWCTCYTNK